jgi:predicted transglutaminase-like cysteine proteinase
MICKTKPSADARPGRSDRRQIRRRRRMALAFGAMLAASALGGSASASEPGLFGFATVKLGPTIYDEIWREASSSALPSHNADLDAVLARLRVLPVPARVRAANAWLNARVSYRPDMAVTDHHWGNLSKALARGAGAHEDIAIAKLQLLAAAGVPRSDMSMVMVRDLARLTTDALLVVRDGERVYVLGGRANELVDANETGRYFPVLAFSSEGQWLFGRRGGAGPRRIAARY